MNEDAALLVREYVETARWFGGKGRDFTVVDVRRAGLLDSAGGADPRVGIELVTLRYHGTGDDTGDDTETYQVPLAYYTEEQERLEHALVGSWKDEELGAVVAYDAVHDREATALWLRAFADEAKVGDLTFFRLPGHELDLDTHSTLFSGEQSNSSVAFGDDCLMKVFRKVTPGRNPDVVIHKALTEQGSDHVAALYGWLELSVGAEDPMQLAMLQQFLRTASDGWDLALASVRDLFAEADLHADEVGGDFAGEAERLGLATAQVHDALVAQFPTEAWGADQLTALSEAMTTRLDAAVAVVPELEDHADALRETFHAVAELGAAGVSATAQRVHGDFHLGQTLRTVKGWKIVDFEGEPAKPLAERVKPDLVWRDVAGMLRSFDYAAHAVVVDFHADEQANRQIAFRAAEWADRNQSAFLRGYADNSGRTSHGGGLSEEQNTILRAYVADKAVYEAVYEARNRPTWLPIPLGALARVTHAERHDTHTDPDPDGRPAQEANPA
ncbi:MAG: maltokinase [Nocardioidaceae bacterium]|nr:maltokinase [Nocardioidaceae bacterium]